MLLLPYDQLMAADFVSVSIDLAEGLIASSGIHALGSGEACWFEVKPKTADELSRVLRLSGQSDQSYSFFPGLLDIDALTADSVNIFIDFSALNAVREHVASDLVIACETGLTITALNNYLSQFGQRFPVDMGVDSDVSLLDLILTGDGGYLETGFGFLRSQILGLESVYADGNVLKTGGRVVKNVTGFDVTKLVIGSRGAFAFPYLAYLRLAALPEAVSSYSVKSKSNDSTELLAVSTRLLSSGLPLSALEIVELENEYQLIVQLEGPSQLVSDLSRQIERELSGFKFQVIDNSQSQNILSSCVASSNDYSVEVAASLSLLRELLESLHGKSNNRTRGRLRLRPACGRLYLHSSSKEQVDSDLALVTTILGSCRQATDGSALASWEAMTLAARYGLFRTKSKRLALTCLAADGLYKRIKEKFDAKQCLNPQANFAG